MRLLILTQKVDQNDSVLGFMHAWIYEFAKQTESVKIICLEKHSHSLPQNVEVLSLGKENKKSKIKYLFNFYKYIWQRRNEYDAVFVHMNHEYVILGGLVWKILGKKITLWYAHGHVSLALRIAHFLSDIVFTSGKSGFRIESPKVQVVGQGIDTEKFKPGAPHSNPVFSIITVGRITPSKDYETLIKASVLLKSAGENFTIQIIGSSEGRSGDKEYDKKIRDLILNGGVEKEVSFLGPISNKELPDYLAKADLFVNMGQTGSIDKVVPEAMAAGLPILTCNEAFFPILKDFSELLYPKKDEKVLSSLIAGMMEKTSGERIELGGKLRDIVVKDHNLEGLIRKIIHVIEHE